MNNNTGCLGVVIVCILPIVIFMVGIGMNDGEEPSSQSSSPSVSDNDFSSETVQDKGSASYCYEIREKQSHPDYQLCLDTAALCAAILDMPGHYYYNDCKNRGWGK